MVSENNKKQRGRIAFFFPWGNLGAFSTLRDALTLLVEHGYQVDFYTQFDTSYPQPEMDMQRLSIINRPEACLFFTNSYPQLIIRLRKGGRPYRWLMMNMFYPLLRTFSFNNFLRKRHTSLPYVCMIGADPEGLASAAPLARMIGVPLAFWSFELLFADEITSSEQKRLKGMEIAASREARFVIVQDRWRGQSLADENGLDTEKLVYVPNAPRGPARRQKSDYLHRRLGIDPGRKIILCAGMVDRWTMSAELVKAAAFWSEEYILVIQSHTPREAYWTQGYLNEIVRVADPSRIAISFDPVPSSDYRAMMDSADVGLVFYAPQAFPNTMQGQNVHVMGLSSGKLSGFLHSGLPVVVNDAVVGPKELVEKWKCGICINTPNQVGDSLKMIFDCYDVYSENAVRCFNDELELEKHFKRVIEEIDKLSVNEVEC